MKALGNRDEKGRKEMTSPSLAYLDGPSPEESALSVWKPVTPASLEPCTPHPPPPSRATRACSGWLVTKVERKERLLTCESQR